jgi:hypothetical protein
MPLSSTMIEKSVARSAEVPSRRLLLVVIHPSNLSGSGPSVADDKTIVSSPTDDLRSMASARSRCVDAAERRSGGSRLD